jgi:hypothetical protein
MVDNGAHRKRIRVQAGQFWALSGRLRNGQPEKRDLRAAPARQRTGAIPRHPLQLVNAVIFERDLGAGDQVFDRLRYEHLTGCCQRGDARADRRPPRRVASRGFAPLSPP